MCTKLMIIYSFYVGRRDSTNPFSEPAVNLSLGTCVFPKAPSTPACLALPGLGYRLQLAAPVPLAPPVLLPTCRSARPTCALFLSPPLPAYPPLPLTCACPACRRREGTKLRLSEYHQIENRKDHLRKLTQHPLSCHQIICSLFSVPPVCNIAVVEQESGTKL